MPDPVRLIDSFREITTTFEWTASSCPIFPEFTYPPTILIMEGLIHCDRASAPQSPPA